MNEEPEAYSHNWDASKGILEMTNRGFWFLEVVDRYIQYRNALWSKIRKFRGPLKVLVDTREMTVQSAEVINRVQQDRKDTVLGPNGRIAIVVASSFVRRQIARTNLNPQFQFFTAIFRSQEVVDGVIARKVSPDVRSRRYSPVST